MGELLNRMRAERPLCRVCGQPCDPDDPNLPVTIILVPLDAHGDEQGMIPVHQGACNEEANDRMAQAQAVVNARRQRQGTEAPWDRAKRLLDEGEATQLDG